LFRHSCAIILGCFILSTSVAFGVEVKKNPQTNLQQEKNEGTRYDIGDFEYKSEGRRDPFEPVLLNKEKAKKDIRISTKAKKVTEEKMGYELEELRLVGVLKSDKGMMAMMENAKGEGIFYRKGDPLNNQLGMWVADITNSNVVFAYKLKGEIRKVVVDLPNKK